MSLLYCRTSFPRTDTIHSQYTQPAERLSSQTRGPGDYDSLGLLVYIQISIVLLLAITDQFTLFISYGVNTVLHGYVCAITLILVIIVT